MSENYSDEEIERILEENKNLKKENEKLKKILLIFCKSVIYAFGKKTGIMIKGKKLGRQFLLLSLYLDSGRDCCCCGSG